MSTATWRTWLVLAGILLLLPCSQAAQSINVKEIGSFYVGGRAIHLENVPARPRVQRDGAPADIIHPDGDFVYGQVYVQFVKLANPQVRYPLLLLHGGSLSGVSFESTPDGREGWRMYVLRAGYSVYVPDAPQSGRSPWARFPEIAPEEPSFRTAAFLWEIFRIGPPGSYVSPPSIDAAYRDTRFPVAAFSALAAQAMPRFRAGEELIRSAYAQLIGRVCPCIVLAHSASGPLGEELTADRPELVKGLILIEPSPGAPLKSDAAKRLAQVPQLIVWGDHLENPDWLREVQSARETAVALQAARASIEWIDLPGLGIHGNSHMMMMDNNSSDIAHLIDRWIRRHVAR